MPLYEYLCQQCGTRSEALQNMGAPPLTTCEKCGGELKRLISSPAVQFKGAGWYVTDYARKSGPGGGAKGEGKSESGDKKSESGDKKSDAGDSKPAETKADKPAASSGGAGSSGSSTP